MYERKMTNARADKREQAMMARLSMTADEKQAQSAAKSRVKSGDAEADAMDFHEWFKNEFGTLGYFEYFTREQQQAIDTIQSRLWKGRVTIDVALESFMGMLPHEPAHSTPSDAELLDDLIDLMETQDDFLAGTRC